MAEVVETHSNPIGFGNVVLSEDGEKSYSQHAISKLVMIFYFFGWLAAFTVPFSWYNFAICIALYWIRMFFVTAGYHRYFSHCSYKTSRIFQFFLAFMAETSLQQGVCWWASHHRTHHKECDTPSDPHSAFQFGFWRSHCTWIEKKENYNTDWAKVPDLVRYPEIVYISEFFVVPPLILAVVLSIVGGMSLFIWGFVVSTWLLSHGTFLVNSANHIWGSQRYICQYQKDCTARNNWWVTVLTLGEGWHNNHHSYCGACRQGFFWYEIDITYYILRVFQAIGLIWDINEPPMELMAKKAEEFRRVRGNNRGESGNGNSTSHEEGTSNGNTAVSPGAPAQRTRSRKVN